MPSPRLTPAKSACLLEAARAGLLVPGRAGRYQRCLALEPARTFHGVTVASLVREGLLARVGRAKGRAVEPTRAGYLAAKRPEVRS